MKRDEFWGAEDEAQERVDLSVHNERCELQLATSVIERREQEPERKPESGRSTWRWHK